LGVFNLHVGLEFTLVRLSVEVLGRLGGFKAVGFLMVPYKLGPIPSVLGMVVDGTFLVLVGLEGDELPDIVGVALDGFVHGGWLVPRALPHPP